MAAFGVEAPIVVRAYPGRTQADAAKLFELEARWASPRGYAPTAQSWGDGRPGIGRVLLIGSMASLALRPKGFLSVTYARGQPSAAPIEHVEAKVCPQCAEEVKAAARICRYCGYAFEEE
jgi:hypothetical protein